MVDQVVGASVDLGSTSVHLLVAAIAGHRLQPLVDESAFLGLGRAVAERGHLGGGARAELTATLAGYARTARAFGATSITFIGTEPIRRAADASRLVHEVRVAAGAPVHVLSHEEEAYLMIIGVMTGLPVIHETLVVDVGGGSSEFCVIDPTHRPRARGLRLGSARLTDRLVAHDPPTATELATMRAAALQALGDAPDATPEEIVVVGGTASNLLKLLPAAAVDRLLTRERIEDATQILVTEPTAIVTMRHGVKPVRARLLAGGATIMAAILDRYGADQIRVSDAGVREGTALAVEHAGPAWRDHLSDLAHGWRS
jgi:exopolyphosphatase/guanosine-5'-triphosphate,3'-diphosphate pyrophosphatase